MLVLIILNVSHYYYYILCAQLEKASVGLDFLCIHAKLKGFFYIPDLGSGDPAVTIGNQEGEWAIIGGTGMFTFAEGTITTYRVQDDGSSNIKEIRIHALLCCAPDTTPTDNW